eukprot:767480-Hanusia_phi.AAC.2
MLCGKISHPFIDQPGPAASQIVNPRHQRTVLRCLDLEPSRSQDFHCSKPQLSSYFLAVFLAIRRAGQYKRTY